MSEQSYFINKKNKGGFIMKNLKKANFSIPTWGITEVSDYQPQFEIWEGFRQVELNNLYVDDEVKVAVFDGKTIQEIRDFYAMIMAEEQIKRDIRVITELSMVLNWSIWMWYKKNDELAKLYDELWRKHEDFVFDNFKDADLSYYYRTTD